VVLSDSSLAHSNSFTCPTRQVGRIQVQGRDTSRRCLWQGLDTPRRCLLPGYNALSEAIRRQVFTFADSIRCSYSEEVFFPFRFTVFVTVYTKCLYWHFCLSIVRLDNADLCKNLVSFRTETIRCRYGRHDHRLRVEDASRVSTLGQSSQVINQFTPIFFFLGSWYYREGFESFVWYSKDKRSMEYRSMEYLFFQSSIFLFFWPNITFYFFYLFIFLASQNR
jgi:hypothetical protein